MSFVTRDPIYLIKKFWVFSAAEILGFNGTESYEIGENRLEHLTIDLEAISPEHASFVVVQAHSQKYSFTASLSDRIAYDNSLNKTNPGFVAYYESSSLEGATNLYLSSDGSVARQLVQAMAVAYPHFGNYTEPALSFHSSIHSSKPALPFHSSFHSSIVFQLQFQVVAVRPVTSPLTPL